MPKRRAKWNAEPKPHFQFIPDADKPYGGGYFVEILHGPYLGKPFFSEYGHLKKVSVSKEQQVKRGQLLGLSGASNSGNAHLHFGLHCGKTGIVNHYDPKKFWLEEKIQCFDSKRNYSNYLNIELTHPIACGEYGESLTSKALRSQ